LTQRADHSLAIAEGIISEILLTQGTEILLGATPNWIALRSSGLV
jgi:hypothetical protein